tara:strand:- start:48 stop:2435 length:2388 start_codon:yes stop_codon:yes gene_type:complete
MQKNVTIFKNIRETETPFYRNIDTILLRIKEGKSMDLVKSIRSEKDKSERNELKKLLPAVCFSGEFTKRADKSIVNHSGFICLDFDNYEKVKEMQDDKSRLSKDKYVYSVFVSPSGKGLKIIVKIPADIDNHVNYFISLEEYFDSPYFDKTSKNIGRVCYESWDKNIYVNKESDVWDKIKEREYKEVDTSSTYKSLPITDETKIIEILMKWWEKKYPMSEGQRNQNAYILAMAFNDYGIPKTTSSYILNQYANEGFTVSELQTTIESAYSNTSKFNTKYYEDEDKINHIRLKLRGGANRKEIVSEVLDENSELSSDDVNKVITEIEKSESNTQFWVKSEKGTIKIIAFSFKKFLEDNGFYKIYPEGSQNYIFVRIVNNLIDNTSSEEIKDFILNYLIQLDDRSIYNFFAEKVSYFQENFLNLLETIDIHFMVDTKEYSYLYYKNCAVKITTDGIETIDYLDLDGYVWRDHVVDRNFSVCDDNGCDYKTFISRICGDKKDRIDTMESTIGFMMHGYKNLSYCPAVILNDEVMSENPEGGTGKGIFMNALSQMKKLVVIDGKAFNFEKSFPYQTVSADTQILCFDDVKKHFDFERLFSVITEGLTLEKKNKDAIKIPYAKSPKVAITTNYAIKGSGNSFARRKWEIELHQHYNRHHTPYDEFGKHFFEDWDRDEWCLFDSYMVNCLSSYMRTGLIESDFVNLKARNLEASTCHDFIEWCGILNDEENTRLMTDTKLLGNELYNHFILDYPDYGPRAKLSMSRTTFYRWLMAYGTFLTGINPTKGKDQFGQWIIINTK